MKKQGTRKRRILWGCLGVAVLVVAVAIGYVISSIPPYPAFYKDLHSLEQVRKELKEMEDICVPEASWLGLVDGTYQLKMDGRFRDAQPEGYYIKGTIQCNGVEVDLACSCIPSDREVAQDELQYRGIAIEYKVYGERMKKEVVLECACTQFIMDGYSYSLYADFPVEAMSEDEMEEMRSSLKKRTMEIAHQIIDLSYERIEG